MNEGADRNIGHPLRKIFQICFEIEVHCM